MLLDFRVGKSNFLLINLIQNLCVFIVDLNDLLRKPYTVYPSPSHSKCMFDHLDRCDIPKDVFV